MLIRKCLLLLALTGQSWADSDILPQPLTLADALKYSRQDMPGLEAARAVQDGAQAEVYSAQALTGVTLSVTGRLRALHPASKSTDSSANDSSASLLLRKRLYDFGHSSALEQAAMQRVQGADWQYCEARQQQTLQVMRGFFDVLLADLEYARDNEAMSIAFIAMDKAREHSALKRLSDVVLLETEAEYQKSRRIRYASEARQRSRRSALAIAMGRPEDLVSDVVMPAIPDISKPLPGYEQLMTEVLEHNPRLLALRASLASARSQLQAARASDGPVLHGELDASVYNRTTASRHPLAAGLVLEVPLLTGGARDARIARANAKQRAVRAEKLALQRELRQTVLDLTLDLGILKVRLQELTAQADFRELYLDRSRALYELEVKTDLGDAMTQISAVRLKAARAQFDWVMTMARLDALRGRLLEKENS